MCSLYCMYLLRVFYCANFSVLNLPLHSLFHLFLCLFFLRVHLASVCACVHACAMYIRVHHPNTPRTFRSKAPLQRTMPSVRRDPYNDVAHSS